MIFLTGWRTLAGKTLLNRLLAKNTLVRCYDFIKPKQPIAGAEFFSGTLTDTRQLVSLMKGAEAVFHCMDIKRPDSRGRRFMKRLNVEGTERLLAAAEQAGVRRFFFISSHAVVGRKSRLAPLLNGSQTLPFTAYGSDKLKAEALCLKHMQTSAMGITVIRPAAMLCPGIKDPAVLTCLFLALGIGKRNRLYVSKGDVRYQLLHTEDFADAVMSAWEEPAAAGKIYNAGADDVPTRAEELQGLGLRLGAELPVRQRAPWRIRLYRLLLFFTGSHLFAGEHFCFLLYGKLLDSSSLKADTLWRPAKSNVDILEETFRWYMKDKLKL